MTIIETTNAPNETVRHECRRQIRFASAPCGAGKTFQLARRAIQMAQEGKKVLIVQPTVKLIEKTIAEELTLVPNGLMVRAFHSAAIDGYVAKQLAEYMADPEDVSQIVLASHQVLPHLPFVPKNGWHLLVDEAMQVDREQSHVVPITHPILTDHIRIKQHDGVYGRVVVSNPNEVRNLSANSEEDELLESFRETASILVNPHWQSFVNLEQYDSLMNDGHEGRLTFHSLLKPSIVSQFASVFIAAANFDDSSLFHLWSRDGIRFVPDTSFTDALRFRSHENGHLTTIHYALQKNWSRNLLEKHTDGIPNLKRMADAALAVFKSESFLWQANASVPNNFFARGDRLPNNPLGLNGFSNVNNIVFLSALNPSPSHDRFLKSLGLNSDEIERQGYCGIGYQAVMRTSLRDSRNQDRKNIVVTDERMAQYLSEMLPGATLAKLDSGIDEAVRKGGRPRNYESNAEKHRSRRKAQKEQRTELLNQLYFLNRDDDGCLSTASDGSDRVRVDSVLVAKRKYAATFYSHVKSTIPQGYLYCADQVAFVFAMEALHKIIYVSKRSIPVFSPAIFDPNLNTGDKSTRRATGNILYLRNIILDFEDGDLRPDEVPSLFPGIEMIVTNSFRHTSAAPRFRVILLTNAAMSPRVYEALFGAIANKLADAGYVKAPGFGSKLKSSGLDYSKRSAASLFHLPSQADVRHESFFSSFVEGRQPLNPMTWVSNLPLNDDGKKRLAGAGGNTATPVVSSAIEKWRCAAVGKGNESFYLLAVELKRSGMDETTVQTTLASEAQFGRSPAERSAQIPSILRTLFGRSE